MTWLLDGNNILGGARKAAGGGGDRERLLCRLQGFKLPSPCVLVFDGPAPGAAATGTRGTLTVVYSGTRRADEVILGRVRQGDHVVTDDRDLALRCRDRRARIHSPHEFLSGLASRAGASPSEKPSPTAVDVEAWMKLFEGDTPGGS